MSKKKPPAKKPAKTTTRTQPPAKPVKAGMVKRPRNLWGSNRTSSRYIHTTPMMMTSTEARQLSAWLLHAAAYIEQEAKRKK